MLSTDVSEEDSKVMANIAQFGATQFVNGKKSAEGIVGGLYRRRPEHEVRRSAVEGKKCNEPAWGSIFLGLNWKCYP